MSETATPGSREIAGANADHAVIWHELECGAYSADMPLWHELAEHASDEHRRGAILDIGAGTGRVALALAREGHRVTALDADQRLLDALAQRAEGELRTACADARSFALEDRDYALCIVPMQTVQLLGGARNRSAFMRTARSHLSAGGLLALAIIDAFEPFDCTEGEEGPDAESTRRDGLLYISRATRVAVHARSAVIERERRIVRERDARELARERNRVRLDRVSAAQLEREGLAAGLTPASRRAIAETYEHVGSAVVMLRA
jgi:SAM-dependent methyltransferase